MKDIICPKCGTAFHVDESTYADILSQVRTTEFKEEIDRRIAELNEQMKTREDSVRLKAEKDFDKQLSQKEQEIGSLKTELEKLKGVISGYDAQKASELSALKAEKEHELFKAISDKDNKINELNRMMSEKDNAHRIDLINAKNEGQSELQRKEQKIIELESKLNNEKLLAKNNESQLRELHKIELQDKQSEIDRLKDFKLRLSTKMVGETLEQHCFILFSQAQSMGLYPHATFEKDNISADGTKGDFIFRDYIDGEEYISIMFEMKNEMDTTATKHKNEDFLEKLDKDRTKKNCEFAVLVSMLEQGNELYDTGIVDKSHRFPKMMVIRPQFFMIVLRLIAEGARKGYMEKKNLKCELEQIKAQNIDLSHFEDKINKVVATLNKNYDVAHKKFVAANEGIDKAIEGLEKQISILREVKANFEAADQKLLRASEIGGEGLTVKRLTHGNPTVRRMIEDADR